VTHFTSVETHDVRFPTSQTLDGSDAMNPDPDYSAAYVRLLTDDDDDDGREGHGFVFTIGRGNDVQVAAIRALARYVVGREVEPVLADLGGLWRELVHDSQLRWLGPERGVMHMAVGAVVNALWDLRAKREGLPLWQLLARLSPQHLERLCREAVADGFIHITLKVGADLEDDVRRLGIARAACGPDVAIAIDAKQRWDVAEAVEWVRELARFDLAWIEEPTSPDDVLGHAAIARGVSPVRVAIGEHCANRVMFEQFLQADALQVLQLEATRVAGVNENLAILLLAARFGVPVCPHAGGVGLCEAVQHLSMFDSVALSGTTEARVVEFVDHLREHFVTPVVMDRGSYRAPTAPGAGTEMLPASRTAFGVVAGG